MSLGESRLISLLMHVVVHEGSNGCESCNKPLIRAMSKIINDYIEYNLPLSFLPSKVDGEDVLRNFLRCHGVEARNRAQEEKKSDEKI